MIPERSHHSILANLSKHAPLDLDALMFDTQDAARVSDLSVPAFAPSRAIWDMQVGAVSRIGVRVRAPLINADVLAARLASIAVERQIHPVFLSYLPDSGMQRFGFRVEQLYGLTPPTQAVFETQLSRFWRFALIIDASEIEHLG